MIEIKRVSDPPGRGDGGRIVVDRLWLRDLSKRDSAVDKWMKDLAPSHEPRRRFGHDSWRWREFRAGHLAELRTHRDTFSAIARKATRGT